MEMTCITVTCLVRCVTLQTIWNSSRRYTTESSGYRLQLSIAFGRKQQSSLNNLQCKKPIRSRLNGNFVCSVSRCHIINCNYSRIQAKTLKNCSWNLGNGPHFTTRGTVRGMTTFVLCLMWKKRIYRVCLYWFYLSSRKDRIYITFMIALAIFEPVLHAESLSNCSTETRVPISLFALYCRLWIWVKM